MNKEKLIKSIPNIFTLANLTCGMIALLVSVFFKSDTSLVSAALLIFLGMIFDFCDGFLARKLNAQSPMGKELDSFADAITFGIAPVVVFLSLHYVARDSYLLIYELVIATFYVMCAVYRLARYNSTESKGYFEGIPSTLSGGLLAILIIVATLTVDFWYEYEAVYFITSLIVILLGVGMVSKFRVNRIGPKKKEESEEIKGE